MSPARTPTGRTTAPVVTGGDGGLFAPRHRAATIGTFALVSLGAFEALALTTVMPVIAGELNGKALYATAFAATLAAQIVSIVLAGNLADRRGPRLPLGIGLVLFAAGLIGGALAPTMIGLVGARVLQGLGAGMTTTALYVMVARVYPARLHTAVFAGFAAAWVLPSIVGPFLAGLIAETFGWRWVFGISLIVLVIAAVLLVGVMRTLPTTHTDVPWRVPALIAAVVVAVGALGLNLVAEDPHGRRLLIGGLAVVIVLVAFVRLTPPGTLRSGRGLPTNVLIRGLAFAAFAGAEIYVPRLLTERDGYPATLAGLALSLTGITWFLASSIQGRWADRIDAVRSARLAMALLTAGLAGIAVTVAAAGPAWVVITLWPVAGFGMGLLYPRVTAQAMSRAGADDQGFVSAAMQISDSTGASIALAFSAIVFLLLAGSGWIAFALVFGLAAVWAALACALAHRIR